MLGTILDVLGFVLDNIFLQMWEHFWNIFLLYIYIFALGTLWDNFGNNGNIFILFVLDVFGEQFENKNETVWNNSGISLGTFWEHFVNKRGLSFF